MAGQWHRIDTQLDIAAEVTEQRIQDINGSGSQCIQTAQKTAIYSATYTVKVCEMMGAIGGSTASGMETRIMKTTNESTQAVQEVLSELETTA